MSRRGQCEWVSERLQSWLQGELADPQARRLSQHLEGCATCQRELRFVRRLIETKRTLPRVPPPAEVLAGVWQRIEQTATPSPAPPAAARSAPWARLGMRWGWALSAVLLLMLGVFYWQRPPGQRQATQNEPTGRETQALSSRARSAGELLLSPPREAAVGDSLADGPSAAHHSQREAITLAPSSRPALQPPTSSSSARLAGKMKATPPPPPTTKQVPARPEEEARQRLAGTMGFARAPAEAADFDGLRIERLQTQTPLQDEAEKQAAQPPQHAVATDAPHEQPPSSDAGEPAGETKAVPVRGMKPVAKQEALGQPNAAVPPGALAPPGPSTAAESALPKPGEPSAPFPSAQSHHDERQVEAGVEAAGRKLAGAGGRAPAIQGAIPPERQPEYGTGVALPPDEARQPVRQPQVGLALSHPLRPGITCTLTIRVRAIEQMAGQLLVTSESPALRVGPSAPVRGQQAWWNVVVNAAWKQERLRLYPQQPGAYRLLIDWLPLSSGAPSRLWVLILPASSRAGRQEPWRGAPAGIPLQEALAEWVLVTGLACAVEGEWNPPLPTGWGAGDPLVALRRWGESEGVIVRRDGHLVFIRR